MYTYFNDIRQIGFFSSQLRLRLRGRLRGLGRRPERPLRQRPPGLATGQAGTAQAEGLQGGPRLQAGEERRHHEEHAIEQRGRVRKSRITEAICA